MMEIETQFLYLLILESNLDIMLNAGYNVVLGHTWSQSFANALKDYESSIDINCYRLGHVKVLGKSLLTNEQNKISSLHSAKASEIISLFEPGFLKVSVVLQ